MSIFKKRREDGFNLAFLDVMACGLGAVILILILVKFSDNTDIPVEELARLEQEIAQSAEQSSELESFASEAKQALAKSSMQASELDTRIAQLTSEQNTLTAALRDKIAVIAELESAIAAAGPQTANDVIEITGAGEESYIVGLKVQGQRIGILLDMSASMTHESLIEVIKTKLASDNKKRSSPKWQRSLAILNWLLARLPKNAEVSVLAFNDTSQVLGKPISRQQNPEELNAIATQASRLVPTEGTNLQQALQQMTRTMGNVSDLYIITDGLPTYINPNSGFNESRGCKPIKGKQATITGECRIAAFGHTMRANPIQGVRTNIILLPLEGDSAAPALYWSWADSTQGTFIAPAGTWP
ncbi:VWA domain-containing protein [Glaciecola siphonariae]|uniref:VWA domain-containing protein n=1 Tax=Glaciecola siphonariae TaxID=521012 RepID=A0ABV9M0G3_9ALTE